MIDIKELGNISNLKLFREAIVLIKEGQVNEELMYIILNGTVSMVKGYGTDSESVVDTLGAGRIFGEQCLFTKINPILTYVTQTPISAIVISKDYFLEIAKIKPHLVVTILEEICKDLAEARLRKPARKASVVLDVNTEVSLLPTNHKGYPIPQPDTYQNFLLQADKTCPYCKTVFNTDLIYNSKLRLKSPAGIDMRKSCTDFDTIWYDVITCPNCYFSGFDEYFERVELIYKSPDIIKALEEIRKSLHLNFEDDRTMDFVFISYYLALICAKAYDNDMQISSKIWLQLTYLYSDAGDHTMHKYALEKARDTFELFYGSVKMKAESEQYCCLVLAHLYLELGDEQKAIMYLTNVRTNKQGNAVYKNMAENKYYDLREARDLEKKQKQ